MSTQTKSDIKEMRNVPYAQAVGSLMYAITSIRPDICHAVGLVSRFQSNPGTKNLKLCFGLCDLNIKGYTDADFAGDVDDRKSTSGHVFLFGGTAVAWLSKKQSCVAKYTMEAEYIACSTAVSNADIVERGEIKVNYIPSEEMVADPMTKGLSLEKFRERITDVLRLYLAWKHVFGQWKKTFVWVRSDWWQKHAHVWPSHNQTSIHEEEVTGSRKFKI
ncbi:hypothetical protein CsSME_00013413 [Camellia sinensis var. sinensis]